MQMASGHEHSDVCVSLCASPRASNARQTLSRRFPRRPAFFEDRAHVNTVRAKRKWVPGSRSGWRLRRIGAARTADARRDYTTPHMFNSTAVL